MTVQALVFLVASVCSDSPSLGVPGGDQCVVTQPKPWCSWWRQCVVTAQVLVFLVASVCSDTAQALVFLVASVCSDSPSLGVPGGVSV